MLDLSDFRTTYGVFRTLSDEAVSLALAQAAKRTDPAVFGDLTDEAHGALTASILWVNNVNGVRSQGTEPNQRDDFGKRRTEIERLVGGFQGGAV